MIVRKVMLVDDEADIREIGAIALSDVGGYETIAVESGTDAVARAIEERPDVILLDVMMPGMDGPRTLQALREHPATCDIPVVFLTAKVLGNEIAQLKKLGAAHVLPKPFDPMTLAAEVQALFTET